MSLNQTVARYLFASVLLGVTGCDSGQSTIQEGYPAKESKAFQVYASQCSQCHAPPLPSAHRADEWPGVIARMENYRIQRAYDPTTASDAVIIRDYLMSFAEGAE